MKSQATSEPPVADNESVTQRFTTAWELSSRIVAMLAGVSYISGFVCVFTFLRSFGISEASLDIFRAKYFQVGAMFLCFPLCCVLPLAILMSRVRESNKAIRSQFGQLGLDLGSAFTEFSCWQGVSHMLVLCVINIVLVLYVISLYFHRELLVEHFSWLGAVWLLTSISAPLANLAVFGLSHSSFFGKRLPADSLARSARAMAWGTTFCMILICDALFLQDSLDDIWFVLVKNAKYCAGLHYFVLILAIPTLLWLVNLRAKGKSDLNERKKAKYEFRLIIVPICIVCGYFAMISFSTYIYPWIPADKGGGDYSESPLVWIQFKARPGDAFLKRAEKNVDEKSFIYGPYIVIEQTNEVMYIVDRVGANGPRSWRRLSPSNKFTLPNVIQIRRDAVETLFISQRLYRFSTSILLHPK